MELECKRVGFWWGDKKSLSMTDFANIFKCFGFELVKLDLTKPLEEQGPFIAIVHKMCHIIIKSDNGEIESQRICKEFEDYCSQHPEVIIIDPIDNVRKLLNRYKQYKLIEKSKLGKAEWFYVPPFVEFTSCNVAENMEKLQKENVKFPIVCKPIISHGMKKAHQMCLVFNEKGLQDIQPPCVAQQFVNHNAVLYKVYVIGQQYHLTRRPSLKNFFAGDTQTIFFNSQDVSKPHSNSPLIEVDGMDAASMQQPTPVQLDEIVDTIRKDLGQTLFGIDIIVEKDTGKLCIIDINNFPGYDGVNNFLELLCRLVMELFAERKQETNNSRTTPTIEYSGDLGPNDSVLPSSTQKSDPAVNTESFLMPCLSTSQEEKSQNSNAAFQEDSGIDTSDSSDEKKKLPIIKANRRQHSRSHSNVPQQSSGFQNETSA